jgi:hypothetical protein
MGTREVAVNPGRELILRGIQVRKHSYVTLFSGKLSSVTTNFEDEARIEARNEARIEPAAAPVQGEQPVEAPREVGGREGPEPTRFGDWELRGRCIDF